MVDVTLVDLGRDNGASDVVGADAVSSVDAPGCVEAAESYAAAVRAAQQCGPEADCSGRVCETLCCTCEVFIDPRAATAGRIVGLRDRWRSLGCAAIVRCPAIPCGDPMGAVCSTDGRCVTLRRDSDAGADGGDAR